MDYNPNDLEDGEFKILVIEKLDALLKNNERVDKRLDSHSGQLKALWGIGGLSGIFAAWVGHKVP